MANRTNLGQLSGLWSTDEASRLSLEGAFVLCLDSPVGGNGANDFPWSLLLLKCLRLGRRVTILSCAHAHDHFVQLLRRHGLDCSSLESEGRLRILRVLPSLPDYDGLGSSSSSSSSGSSRSSSSSSIDAQTGGSCWAGGVSLAQARAAVDGLAGKAPADAPCLFVDDLEALDALGESAAQGRSLVALACAALQAQSVETLVCFGRGGDGGHVDDGPDDGAGWASSSLHCGGGPSLAAYCAARAHVLVRVGVMQSGASSEAQGRLDVDYLASWGALRCKAGAGAAAAAERMVYKVTGADSVQVASRKAGL